MDYTYRILMWYKVDLIEHVLCNEQLKSILKSKSFLERISNIFLENTHLNVLIIIYRAEHFHAYYIENVRLLTVSSTQNDFITRLLNHLVSIPTFL